ncbi:hypothetical protein D3C74_470220 [compost metagenome]
MNLLQIYVLEQLLYLFHHGIKALGQETELIATFRLDSNGVILLLQPLESAYQLFHRHLNLNI